MNDIVFVTLLATGFAVGFLHAVIPTHWLPFVVAARTQHWSRVKTLTVTGFAGAGHVLLTTALGVLVVWGGMAINSRLGNGFAFLAGGALITVGIFYFVRQMKGGHGHFHLLGNHSHHTHRHEHAHNEFEDEERALEQNWSQPRSEWVVILGLMALLTFSPCEAFLPVFLTGAKYGWAGFALLSSILAIATISGMITFTWLTLLGLQRLRFKMLENYEPFIISGVFCILGVLVIILER